jgi:protein SCO1/2
VSILRWRRTDPLRPALACALGVLLCVAPLSGKARAQVVQDHPKQLQGVDVEEHLGTQIPLDLTFVSGDGDSVALGHYFQPKRPVILILAYYTCPMLCSLVANGVSDAVKELAWTPGREFQIVSVSIDPRDTREIARAKRDNYRTALNKPGMAPEGWDFLTGSDSAAHALAEAIGFKYYFDQANDQYAHPAVITLLDPNGKITRYLYGIEFKENDLRLALIEASEGKLGTTVDRIILSCYHYDPDAQGYVVFAGGLMRLGGVVSVILLALFLGILWLREKRRKAPAAAEPSRTPVAR